MKTCRLIAIVILVFVTTSILSFDSCYAHIIDDENSILVIDNPLFKDERIASLQVTNRTLSRQLREGYNALWDEAKQI